MLQECYAFVSFRDAESTFQAMRLGRVSTSGLTLSLSLSRDNMRRRNNELSRAPLSFPFELSLSPRGAPSAPVQVSVVLACFSIFNSLRSLSIVGFPLIIVCAIIS